MVNTCDGGLTRQGYRAYNPFYEEGANMDTVMIDKYYFCQHSQGIHVDIVLDPQHPQKDLYCSVFSVVEYKDCKQCPYYIESVYISDIGDLIKGIEPVQQIERLSMTMAEYEEIEDMLKDYERESEEKRNEGAK